MQLRLRQQLGQAVVAAIDARRWTQSQAAKYLGATQPHISELRAGRIERFSLSRLIDWLEDFGQAVTLQIGPVGLAEDPQTDAETVLADGLEQARCGHRKAAFECFQRYQELRPRCPLGLLHEGRLWLDNDQPWQALVQGKVLTRDFPDYAPGRMLNYDVRRRLGHTEEAASELAKAQALLAVDAHSA